MKRTSSKVKRVCVKCGKTFYVWPYVIKNRDGKYCSSKCFRQRSPKLKRVCIVCRKTFMVSPCHATNGRGKCCSMSCANSLRFLGKKHTKEAKDKISKSHMGDKHYRWKGKKCRHSGGYILVYKPNHPRKHNNHIFQHRLVMEKHLGRYLRPEERVHHINKIRDDNRIKNLRLFANESKHQRFHRLFLLAWL